MYIYFKKVQIALYPLNVYNFIYQLCLNEAGKKFKINNRNKPPNILAVTVSLLAVMVKVPILSLVVKDCHLYSFTPDCHCKINIGTPSQL
jgi:hypothetical protein